MGGIKIHWYVLLAIFGLFSYTAKAIEFDIPSYQNSPIKARFRLVEAPNRFETSVEMQNHDLSKGYTINIYDSSTCADLSRKVLIYAKSKQGYRLVNDTKNYDLLTIEEGPRETMGVFSVGDSSETLYNSVRGKVVAVREAGGAVVACGVMP